MSNHRLITIGAALAVWNLAGCADRDEQMTRAWQGHDECLKFGVVSGTPAYRNCRVALGAIESIQRAALSPPAAPGRREARALKPGRDGDELQHVEHRDESPGETGCRRVIAAQLVIFKCGLDSPLADLLAGLDQ